MKDKTEGIRRGMVAEQQVVAALCTDEEIIKAIREHNEDACDTNELQEQYEVLGFMAPFVVVRRKSDGVKGCLMFNHNPRIYYGFKKE